MGNWQDEGACVGKPSSWWFAEGDSEDAIADRRRAKKICVGCPVREQCITFGITIDASDGLFGGLDREERVAIAHLRGVVGCSDLLTERPYVPKHDHCGTNAGYVSVRRKILAAPNESLEMCPACLHGHNVYSLRRTHSRVGAR